MVNRTATLVLAASVGVAACLGHEEKHVEMREYKEPPTLTRDVLRATTAQTFNVIGFTSKDILAGAHMRLMRHLIPTAAPRRVVKKPVEVYFFDPFVARDDDAFEERYGNTYQSVYFYNETALALSKHHGIELPPVIARIKKNELPPGYGTSIQHPTFAVA